MPADAQPSFDTTGLPAQRLFTFTSPSVKTASVAGRAERA
jgi:hypothetical protein